MKRCVLACLLALVASAAFAQSTATLSWTQPSASLTDVQAYVFTLSNNGGAPVTLTATCAQAGTAPVTCTAPIAAPVAGVADSYVLTATNALGSASSAPLAGTPPSVSVQLVITIKQGQ